MTHSKFEPKFKITDSKTRTKKLIHKLIQKKTILDFVSNYVTLHYVKIHNASTIIKEDKNG